MKRKRGRPKGSTKKTRTDVTEGNPESTHSPVQEVQEEKQNTAEADLKGLTLNY